MPDPDADRPGENGWAESGYTKRNASPPDVISRIEAIRDRCPSDEWPFSVLHEHAVAALEILNGCTRAWRDTANGKEWFLLVPIDTPADDRPAAAQSPE